MFNKWLILSAVALLAGIIFMPEISAGLANAALSKTHAHKTWAPDLAYRAAKINLLRKTNTRLRYALYRRQLLVSVKDHAALATKVLRVLNESKVFRTVLVCYK